MSSIKYIGPAAIRPGDTFTISAMCRDDNTVAEIDLGVSGAIRRASDGRWWDQGLLQWIVLKAWTTLPQLDAVNLRGVYAVSFNHADLNPAKAEEDYYIEVQSDAVGAPSDPTDVAFVQARHDIKSLKLGDAEVVDPVIPNPIVNLFDLLRALKALMAQDTQLDDVTKTMKIFDEAGKAGANVILEFDVKDAAGLPSVREVMQRLRT